MVWGLVQAVADFLVDERCHACGASVDARAPVPAHPASRSLAAPVPTLGWGTRRVRTRLLCGACLQALRAASRAVLVAERVRGGHPLAVLPAFITDARLLALIHLLKFGRRECVAPWLARAMARGLPSRARAAGALVVPVPMDPASQRRRGFNQAERIARELARLWGLPLVADALAKPEATGAQSLLGRADRERNLAAAFAPGRRSRVVAGRRVILVDDLVTTGATARACARALRGAGAARVQVVCAGWRP